jgi:hypothetical protein
LKKDGQGLEFILFPMIDIGSQELHDEVSERLAKCDLILAEGVDSKKASLPSQSLIYEGTANNGKGVWLPERSSLALNRQILSRLLQAARFAG